jgi:hypothetical protein
MKAKILLSVLLFSVVFFLLSAGCSGPLPAELVLNDFESDADLDRIHWGCHTLFSLSDKHVSHGARTLEMKLFPAVYPGLSLKLNENNWSRYDSIALDIYNPQDEMLEITFRIDDKQDYPEYEDRYNGCYQLSPGINHLRIPLDSLKTSGSGRLLNLKTIKRFLFFLVDTQEIYILYVDNIRLES